MDRRGFFKIIISSSPLVPLLFASKSLTASAELYLIADAPHNFIALILEELKKFGIISGRNFALRNFHPHKDELIRALSQKGWRLLPKLSSADISLSCSHLHHAALPSFTLIKEGRIWDIRSQKLLSLWKEMNKNEKPSSCLTIASFKKEQPAFIPGSSASIYVNGRKREDLSLKHNFSHSFTTHSGCVTVAIENGKAWIRDSSCRNKICLFSSPVFLVGERIICAPNQFLLEIKGRSFVDTVIG